MTAFATTAVERDGHTQSATQLLDSSFEFASIHYAVSHIYVRYTRTCLGLRVRGGAACDVRYSGPTPLSWVRGRSGGGIERPIKVDSDVVVPIFIGRGPPLHVFARYRCRASENTASVRRQPHVILAGRRLGPNHR